MSEDDEDLIYDRKEQIWEAVHDLVDEMTKDLPPHVELEVRQSLTETFRFWKRTQ